MQLSFPKDAFAIQLHSHQNPENRFGYKVQLLHSHHGMQEYRNVTTFLWNSDTGMGVSTPRTICNSSIHQTGNGWDAKEVTHVKLCVEMEIAPAF